MKHILILLILALMSNACSVQTGRYQDRQDSTPVRKPVASELIDAIPRKEPHSRGGNKNYQVRGNSYQVLKSSINFKQTGIASWYGKKFHGHLTSNGEIYNMYNMSAAHKNLPLPTYLKVINNDNNKSVIVRVNDRGPFHQNRIIDLSYSAAYKLDMLKTGTANVTIMAVNDVDTNINKKIENSTLSKSISSKQPSALFIQVFATRNKILAEKTAKALHSLYQQPSISPEKDGFYRVQMGPFTEKDQTNDILNNLKKNGYPNAFRVSTP